MRTWLDVSVKCRRALKAVAVLGVALGAGNVGAEYRVVDAEAVRVTESADPKGLVLHGEKIYFTAQTTDNRFQRTLWVAGENVPGSVQQAADLAVSEYKVGCRFVPKMEEEGRVFYRLGPAFP